VVVVVLVGRTVVIYQWNKVFDPGTVVTERRWHRVIVNGSGSSFLLGVFKTIANRRYKERVLAEF